MSSITTTTTTTIAPTTTTTTTLPTTTTTTIAPKPTSSTSVSSDGGIIYIRQGLDGTGQQYSTDKKPWKDIDWSFTIINISTSRILTVQFTTDITFNIGGIDNNKYFIIGSDNIEIDGGNKVVTINGQKDYQGLIH